MTRLLRRSPAAAAAEGTGIVGSTVTATASVLAKRLHGMGLLKATRLAAARVQGMADDIGVWGGVCCWW